MLIKQKMKKAIALLVETIKEDLPKLLDIDSIREILDISKGYQM